MTPADLSFPSRFTEFRDCQLDAIDFVLTSERRFCGLGLPTGSGKSGVAYAIAKLLGGKTILLTSSLGLEQQYLSDFAPTLFNIHGRANYSCWSGGTCEDGGRQGCADHKGCPYKIAFNAFNAGEIGITNYAYWLAVHAKGGGLIAPDTLILDEAGSAVEWLSRSLDFYLTEKELHTLKYVGKTLNENIPEWQANAPDLLLTAQAHYTSIKVDAKMSKDKRARELKYAEGLVDRCGALLQLTLDNWVVTRIEEEYGKVWRFECIWPGRYRERLFRGVKRVILMSATLRPKTFGLLGVGRDDIDFKEWGRQFPAANGPVVWVPTARVNHRITQENEDKWIGRHNEIFDWGSDRNGIVHTVSYDRARRISNSVRPGYSLILNGAADPESRSARESYAKLVSAKKPSVLISPSFSTGWDFAGKRAEWQCISKLAFPDTRSKVMQARCELDPTYPDYIAAQDFVQACGRIVRSETDRGMTLLIDDSWSWFKQRAANYVPKWFVVRREEQLPRPLEKL